MGRWVRGLAGAAVLLVMTPQLCSAQASGGALGTGAVAGRIVRPDGLPQPDAQVVLAERTAAGALRQLPWRARTAFDGRYEITGVPPGRYLVLVRAIGADTAAAGRPDATLFPGVPLSEAWRPGGRCRRLVHRRHRRVAGALAPAVHTSAGGCSGPAARRRSTRW